MHMRHILFPICSREHMVCPAVVLKCLMSMLFHLGGPPATALFATNARYKREAFRGSEFAPRILANNGIKVVMKVR
jgi:hypothetical protein